MDLAKAEHHYAEFCKAVGVDITLEDTKDTPRRVAKLFAKEFTEGQRPHEFEFTTFKALKGINQLVSMPGIHFSSLCRHHHLPVIGYAHVAYLPRNILAGLSKIPRLVQWYAAQPTVQEEMTHNLLKELVVRLKPKWAAIQVIGLHTCMSCRGVGDYESRTITSATSTRSKLFSGTQEEFERAVSLWYSSKGIL